MAPNIEAPRLAVNQIVRKKIPDRHSLLGEWTSVEDAETNRFCNQLSCRGNGADSAVRPDSSSRRWPAPVPDATARSSTSAPTPGSATDTPPTSRAGVGRGRSTGSSPHLTVEHGARAMAVGMAIRDRPAVTLAAQIQVFLQDDSRQVAGRPSPGPAESLREAATVWRVVRVPDPSGHVREQVLQVLGPVSNLEPPVQETQQDDHLCEQRRPRRLSPLPALSTDGLRGVLGCDIARLRLGFLSSEKQVMYD